MVRIVPHVTCNQVSSGLCEMHSLRGAQVASVMQHREDRSQGRQAESNWHTVSGGLSFSLVLGIGPAVVTAHKPSSVIYLSSLELACSGKSRRL